MTQLLPGSKFIARRTRTRMGQVVTHYVAVLAVCALFVVVLVLADRVVQMMWEK